MHKEVRKHLHARKTEKCFFQAKVKIYGKDRKSKIFDTPDAAADELWESGINMEIPVKEPDVESKLQAACWQTVN